MVTQLRGRQARLAARGAADSGYDIPYTTIHVGKIAGGVALNIVPDRCTIDFEIRSVAEDDMDAMVGEIAADAVALAEAARRQAPEADIKVDVAWGYPGLATPTDGPSVRWLSDIVEDASLIKVDFGTEGGLFHDGLGIPVLVCGPGSMDQGHKPDEFVSLDQLARCDRMMERIVEGLAA
jgi:acetylornithine deacetylase